MRNNIRFSLLFAILLLLSSVQPAQATTERTWLFVVNQANPSSSSVADMSHYHYWFMKEVLTGGSGLTFVNQAGTTTTPSAGVWTVSGSSDGSTAAMDATDRWTHTFDTTKIVRATAGTAHSWIALANGNWKCVIDYSTALDYQVNFVCGYGAFAGGTLTTARPTIATEITTYAIQVNDNTATAWRSHGMLATNGDFWFLASKNGSGWFWHALGGGFLANLPSWDPTYNFVMYTRYDATGVPCRFAPSTAHTLASMSRFGRTSTTTQPAMPSLVTSGGGSNILIDTLTDPDPNGSTPRYEIHIIANDGTAARTDYKGRWPDFYANVGRNNGDITPGTGTPDYTAVGRCWIPFNTAPSL